MKKYLLSFIFISFSLISFSQEIKIVNSFSEIEKRFQLKNDTVYLVNFWATWCKPCIMEMPNFITMQEEFKDKKLKIWLISLDFPDKVETQLKPFIERKNIKSEVSVLADPDANAWIEKVSETWSGAIPATLIFNSKAREFYEKEFTEDELRQLILKFL